MSDEAADPNKNAAFLHMLTEEIIYLYIYTQFSSSTREGLVYTPTASCMNYLSIYTILQLYIWGMGRQWLSG